MCNNLVTTKQAHVEGLAFETGIITQLRRSENWQTQHRESEFE
jgi:hypothetical protein